ncbi:MAG: PA14 domain-containing protein [Candidatus Falkowbacteria bacterium]
MPIKKLSPPKDGQAALSGKTILVFLLFLLMPFCLARAAEGLPEKLKGRILLQVEGKGEAWYVNADNQKRFYLGRPTDAFKIMRELGLGVSNKDFDSFGQAAPERLAGKILLKVEDLGKAYYVNPLDLTMHYLGRPQDAFNVMRNLGLGITNNNLSQIEIDQASAHLPAAEEAKASEGEAPEETADAETPAESTGESGETATSTEEIAPAEDTATSTEEVAEDTAEAAAPSCVWLAEYFDNKSLFGSPIATSAADKVDFDWVRSGPAEIIKIDNFSVRFTADCYFEQGNYEFQTAFDDAIRVYLDGENFLQSWTDNNKERIFNRERNIEDGNHEVKVEYYDAIGNAKIKVDWVKIE